MMPDMERYAFAVLSSYGVTLALLVALIGLSLRRGRMARQALHDVEKRVRGDG